MRGAVGCGELSISLTHSPWAHAVPDSPLGEADEWGGHDPAQGTTGGHSSTNVAQSPRISEEARNVELNVRSPT